MHGLQVAKKFAGRIIVGTDLEVRILKKEEYPLWDALVIKSPQGTVFHSSIWVSTCAELSNKNEVIMGVFKNNSLFAGCALYSHNKYKLFSLAVSTATMTPYGGYLFMPFENTKVRENEQMRNAVISAINSELIKKYHYLNIVNPPEISDIRPFVWNAWKPSIYYSYFFNLDGNLEEKISKKVRNTIRKSQKSGISIQRENDPDLYYKLTLKTYEKQLRKPPVTKKFLLEMIKTIISNNLGEMWIARTSMGEPAAGEIIVWDHKRAHRWSATSDAQYKDSGATSLLLFEILQNLQTRGFHEINLMAGNTPRLTKFVSSFNPQLIPYYGVEKIKFPYNYLQCGYQVLKNCFSHNIMY